MKNYELVEEVIEILNELHLRELDGEEGLTDRHVVSPMRYEGDAETFADEFRMYGMDVEVNGGWVAVLRPQI